MVHAHVSKLYFSQELKAIILPKCAAGFWQIPANVPAIGHRSLLNYVRNKISLYTITSFTNKEDLEINGCTCSHR